MSWDSFRDHDPARGPFEPALTRGTWRTTSLVDVPGMPLALREHEVMRPGKTARKALARASRRS